MYFCSELPDWRRSAPSSHSNNSATKICSKGRVAQKPLFDRQFDGGAKIFQGLGPKRREPWIANWVYSHVMVP